MCSMVRKLLLAGPILLFAFSPNPLGWGQTNQKTYVAPRLTQVVDETNLFRLRGNTHRLARPELDMGAAPANLPMQRMLLVLRRSPEQESALRKLLDEQQDKSSPDYHRWLTPEDFGQRFGPSDPDIQVISSWLQSHGFQVARVAKGRTVIEFSGTAAQVQEAFHTAIHKYLVKGEEHWANASDPQIPVALSPVVAGVHTLHNFYKKPQLVRAAQTIKAQYDPGRPPKVTFPGQPGQPVSHALAPGDYAVIYNFQPLYSSGIDGSGTTIAVVARSDLYLGGTDVFYFHSIFGITGIGSLITINEGPDPGDLGGGEEAEATLDATWASALAPGANVEFVVSASTDSTDGVDLSELYIIDNNLADVMTESFGACEQDIVSSGASLTNISSLAEQAAAQGITYLVASGDSGSAGCDNPNAETVASGGLAVSGLAATPYAVAVGGTMFNEHGSDSTYWNSTNNQTNFASAKSYIPESVWNESCTAAQCGKNANIFAGGGGVSTFFQKPLWQTALTPVDGFRDLPDVSLTASGHDFYLLCLEGSCVPDSQGFISLFGVGGTSASTPSFAAIMALVNQKMTSSSNPTGRQGQADYVLYSLAANENWSQCNGSSTTAVPINTCIFNDVTAGNNIVPGESGQSYAATRGYDLATGLGSVNVANLVNNWDQLTLTGTSTTLALNSVPGPITINHGQSVTVQIQVSQAGGSVVPSGDVALLAATGVTGQTVGFFPLSSGNASSATTILPGGTSYNVTAHYPGDASFLPSDSNAVSVTVNPEQSVATVKAETLDQNFNFQPFTTGPYGSFVYLRADVSGNSKQGTPTGSVSFMDGVSNIATYNLNSQGNTTTPNYLNSQIGGAPSGLFTLNAGSHSITANYAGDPSFNSSVSSPITLNITPATTATTVASAGAPQGATLTATVNTTSGGNAPSGTVSFFINGAQVGSPVPITGSQGPTTNPHTFALVGVQGIASFTDTALANGQYTLTATYAGDPNYTGSSAAATTIIVKPDFVLSSDGNSIGVIAGGTGSLLLNIAANDGFTGTVQFSCSGLPSEGNCVFAPSTIVGSGSTTLTVSTKGLHQTAMAKHGSNLRAWSGTVALMLAGFCLVGCPKRRQRNKSLALLVFALLLTISGCGGGGGGGGSSTHSDPGTPTGTYNVTVTASSGSLSHNVFFTLFVQ